MDPNLSYIHNQVPPENCSRPAPTLLDEWAEKTPDKEAFVYVHENGRDAITFRQLQEKTKHLASWLLKFELKKGDRVAIFSRNCVEYVICDLALMRLGVCLTRLYATLSAQQDLPGMILKSDSKLVIVEEKFMDSVLEFIPELLFRQNGSNLESPQFPDLLQVITMGKARDGFLKLELDYQAIDDELAKVAEIQASIKMEDDCTIQPTSGSTGKPKLGVTSFDGYTNLLYQTFHACGLDSEDRLFHDRPMAHPLGSIMAMVQFGCTMVVANSTAFKKSDKEFLLNAIVNERVTAAIFMPYLMYDIVSMGQANQAFSNLKFAISSGQAAPIDITAKICQVVKMVCICYGCGEIGDISCTEPGDDFTTITQTVGKPIPHLQVRVVDENQKIVPRNTSGMIEIKGTSFKRYHGDAAKTAETVQDGWFRPGDIAQIDGEGRIRLLGRQTEIILSIVKCFPLEIENRFADHPRIDKVVAFGIPHRRLKEVIGLCVKPKAGETLTEKEIIEYFDAQSRDEDSLTEEAMKINRVIVRESLPLTSSGKLDRASIKRQCSEELNC